MPGAVCPPPIKFHRFIITNPSPESLVGVDLHIDCPSGSSVSPYMHKRISGRGWMATIPSRTQCKYSFQYTEHVSKLYFNI